MHLSSPSVQFKVAMNYSGTTSVLIKMAQQCGGIVLKVLLSYI
jgi:hypothetical protein